MTTDRPDLSHLSRAQMEAVLQHLFELDLVRMTANNEFIDMVSKAENAGQVRNLVIEWSTYHNELSKRSDDFISGVANASPALN